MASKPQRLFVKSRLGPKPEIKPEIETEIELEPAQAHYLINVLRCKAGDQVLLFNGVDGEWLGEVAAAGKKKAVVAVIEQTRPQAPGPDLHYLFAPLKRARLDYMAQKATEMGASLLQPVITRRTVAERVKRDRLEANAVEAAEQCGILWVPEVAEPAKLSKLLAGWDPGRLLIFADEAASVASPIAAMLGQPKRPLALLIGPEGGFETDERADLLAKPYVLPISLGPRVMRADTAAVAALALINAVLGDWR
jgi:16S rRNA (uracil1498-N3)-methyltransferase